MLRCSDHCVAMRSATFLSPALVLLHLVLRVSAQLKIYTNLTEISEVFPPLTNLTSYIQSNRPGSQNLTHCCLLAINNAFAIEDGVLILKDPSFFAPGTTAESFMSAVDQVGFPCTATFNGNEAGAPLVKCSYGWCKNTCKGSWQISSPSKLQQWAGPLLQFIVPCLAFSISIPRRRQLAVSDDLFKTTLGNWHGWRYLLTPLKALLAVVIVSTDILIWLGLCFAFAGPMVFSGIYEAFLDKRLLHFVVEGMNKGTIARGLATRLLHVILVGNLTFRSREGDCGERYGDPWCDLERHLKEPDPASRLSSMLGSQSSFASAVGAPIVFFAGGFIYSLRDILSSLGNNDTAHTLAFGMWWMTIPHVAIVSSLLLAGNNPLVFQTVTGAPSIECKPRFHMLALAYDSCYQTEWMWFRGRSKYVWIDRILRLNPNPELKRKTTLGWWDWVTTIILTQIILFVPFFLAFLTSYYTPQVGLGCRSLTFLVYFMTQTCQVMLWVWVYASCTVCEGGIMHSPAHYTKNTMYNRFRCVVYWVLACLFGVTSIFAAIGGTIMQLLGVYRNCLCALPVRYWSDRFGSDGKAYISLGPNTRDDILSAQTWWIGTGAAAVAFLCVSAYWGWWYQRRLRGIFKEVVKQIRGEIIG